jgi:hypothetical protein
VGKRRSHATYHGGFKQLLSLLGIQGVIDVAQIHIQKLKVLGFAVDYYSFKSKAYNMQLQVIINCHKHFFDVFVGMLGTMNHIRVLSLFLIYQKVT